MVEPACVKVTVGISVIASLVAHRWTVPSNGEPCPNIRPGVPDIDKIKRLGTRNDVELGPI